jgi:Protein of unknown function (DUF3014)
MKNNSFIIASLIFGSAALGIGYYLSRPQTPKTEAPATVAQSEKLQAQYPIEDDKPQTAPSPTAPTEVKPGPISVFDWGPKGETIDDKLTRFFGAEKFGALINSKDLAHQFVVMVQNICERRPSGIFSLFTPLSEEFHVDSTDDMQVLSAKNFARYAPYLDLLSSVDAPTLVHIYTRSYKTFQSAYAELGMGGYFNDRLINAVDIVLATPDVNSAVALEGVGPYKFTNTEYEALPAAQKILIRMGPDNEKLFKNKLRELRGLLVRPHKP